MSEWVISYTKDDHYYAIRTTDADSVPQIILMLTAWGVGVYTLFEVVTTKSLIKKLPGN